MTPNDSQQNQKIAVPDSVYQAVCIVDPHKDMSWARLLSDKDIKTDLVHAKDRIRPGTDNAETLSQAVKILKQSYVLKVNRNVQCSSLFKNRQSRSTKWSRR